MRYIFVFSSLLGCLTFFCPAQVIEDGSISRKLEQLEQQIRVNPDEPSSYYNRGLVYLKQKAWVESRLDFKKYLSLCPDQAKGWNNLAATQFHLQEYPEALDSWERALKLEPDSIVFFKNKIIVLQKLKRYSEALALIEQRKLNGFRWHVLKADLLHGLDRPEEEIKELKAALESNPDNADLRYRLANLIKKRGHIREAKEEFMKLTRPGKGQMPEAFYQLALLEYKENNLNQSLSYIDRWLLIYPNDVTGLQFQAYLRETVWQKEAYDSYKKGLISESRQLYDKLIKEFPEKAVYYFNRGLCLMKLNKNEEAIRDFTFVLSLHPRHQEALYQRGRLFLLEKGWKDAASDFLALSAVTPSKEIWLNLSVCSYNMDEEELSNQYYQKARDMDPSLPEYHEFYRQK
ncbi:MAG: tetratricopeptide repeat protein [Candidatus Aureabacteria bacterium]|nr:tetratricopeptide repeat protein [Candidatus Auribacterota bacterium]